MIDPSLCWDDWNVEDIIIGRRSQFLQRGSIPGFMFDGDDDDAAQLSSFVDFDTPVHVGAVVCVILTYHGALPEGSRFEGALIGEVGQHPDGSRCLCDPRCTCHPVTNPDPELARKATERGSWHERTCPAFPTIEGKAG